MLPPVLLQAHVVAHRRASVEEDTEGLSLDEWRARETSRRGEFFIFACACVCVIILFSITAFAFLSLYSEDLGLANSTTTLLPHTSRESV
jgi:hypothetical protein